MLKNLILEIFKNYNTLFYLTLVCHAITSSVPKKVCKYIVMRSNYASTTDNIFFCLYKYTYIYI